MTSLPIPRQHQIVLLSRAAFRLWLQVFQHVRRHGYWIPVTCHVQRHASIRAHLRDLGRDPAMVAALGFSISHARYLARERISTR